MGTVWRARDEVLHREVAVKEVRAPAGLATSEVERLYARLEREAWAAARVSNRNVVTVYDVATDDGRPWIVMELVRGLSLSDQLDAEGPLSPQRAAHIGAEVLAALRAAHEAGVLHRDVKPANVLLSNDGRVVLTDFGIATVEGSSALTMTGELIGSPRIPRARAGVGAHPGPRVRPVVARRAAVRGGRGQLALPAEHPAQHPARHRGRGVAAAAQGGAADARHRGAAAQGSGRTSRRRGGRARSADRRSGRHPRADPRDEPVPAGDRRRPSAAPDDAASADARAHGGDPARAASPDTRPTTAAANRIATAGRPSSWSRASPRSRWRWPD